MSLRPPEFPVEFPSETAEKITGVQELFLEKDAGQRRSRSGERCCFHEEKRLKKIPVSAVDACLSLARRRTLGKMLPAPFSGAKPVQLSGESSGKLRLRI